jgi:hypothetical protein
MQKRITATIPTVCAAFIYLHHRINIGLGKIVKYRVTLMCFQALLPLAKASGVSLRDEGTGLTSSKCMHELASEHQGRM